MVHIGWGRAPRREDTRDTRDTRDVDFADFVSGAWPGLCRTAALVVGDRHLAEDVVQTALVAVYRRWDRIEHADGAGPYARRAVVNAALSELRRPHRRREHPRDAVPEHPDPGARPEVDDAVMAAVRSLPPRQRAVVVLRYVDDVDVATTASVLGISEGTVKSQSSKALASLRTHLSELPELADVRPSVLTRRVPS